ncbi:hypothetical protein C8T65DRAFT_40875 [Cerioporus squamosus]|nr:hypothetical protein C8T65DRAFT_40875 [Cerioporus squamosus]
MRHLNTTRLAMAVDCLCVLSAWLEHGPRSRGTTDVAPLTMHTHTRPFHPSSGRIDRVFAPSVSRQCSHPRSSSSYVQHLNMILPIGASQLLSMSK